MCSFRGVFGAFLFLSISRASGLAPWFNPSQLRASAGFTAAVDEVWKARDEAYAESSLRTWHSAEQAKVADELESRLAGSEVPTHGNSFATAHYPSKPPSGFGDDQLAFTTAQPLFTAAECAAVINEAEACAAAEADSAAVSAPSAAHPTKASGWAAQRQFYYARDVTQQVSNLPNTKVWFEDACRLKLFPLLQQCFPEMVPPGRAGRDRLRVFDAKVLKYNASAGQAFLGSHRDGCQLTVTVALNTWDDYQGGGTFFEPLNHALRYDQGHACCHPGLVRHGGQRLESGVRYVMVAFVDVYGRVELDRAFANHADLLRLAGNLDDSLKWYAYSLCAGGGWVERDDSSSGRSSSSSRSSGRNKTDVNNDLSNLATTQNSAKGSEEAIADGSDDELPVPSSEATWVGVGQLRLEQRNWEEAASAFNAALDICPRNVKAWTNLGLALSQQRKDVQQKLQQTVEHEQSSKQELSKSVDDLFESAVRAFRTAASLSDFDTEPFCNLALLLGEAGQHAAAVAALQDAAARAATDRDLGSGGCSRAVEADVQCRLGVALYDSGDLPGAMVAFEAALDLDPSNTNARANAAALRAASVAAQGQ